MVDVSTATSKPESSQQSKARRSRSALGRARLALEAPRPALRATVARRLRSGRARPAKSRRHTREHRTTYKYWPTGELRSKTTDGGVTEYSSYNALGYLAGGMLPNGTTLSYAYDGFGRRVQKV